MLIIPCFLECDVCGARAASEQRADGAYRRVKGWSTLRFRQGVLIRPGESAEPKPDRHLCSRSCGALNQFGLLCLAIARADHEQKEPSL